eukprot:2980920-Pyramimonas_sp.AAC.1
MGCVVVSPEARGNRGSRPSGVLIGSRRFPLDAFQQLRLAESVPGLSEPSEGPPEARAMAPPKTRGGLAWGGCIDRQSPIHRR